jgi:hypothetical protein
MTISAGSSAPRKNELLLPYPHPGQIAVRQQARRFNWLAAGRRWRKTSLVMTIAAEAALRGQQILWGAPIYDQVRIGWEELRHGAARVATFNNTLMTARFPTGGTITFRSLDNPDSARGHTADGVVLDETADIAADAWSEVLRPTPLDPTDIPQVPSEGQTPAPRAMGSAVRIRLAKLGGRDGGSPG